MANIVAGLVLSSSSSSSLARELTEKEKDIYYRNHMIAVRYQGINELSTIYINTCVLLFKGGNVRSRNTKNILNIFASKDKL